MDDFGVICVCAVRYALGRMTYMPQLVQNFVRTNIDKLGYSDIQTMIMDIKECKDYGMECDKKGWMQFLDCLEIASYKVKDDEE